MKNKFKLFCGAVVSLMLGAFLATTALAAMPPEQNVAPPGDQNFVSLNQYSTPTEFPGIYKITLDIVPPEIVPPPIYVTFILDRSGSMGTKDIWDSTVPAFIERNRAIRTAVAKALDELSLAKNANTFISVHSYDSGDTNLSGGFKPLDIGSTRNPLFDPASGTWVMNGFASSGTTKPGASMTAAHGEFLSGMNNYSSTGVIGPNSIPVKSSRYVLIMGDGHDETPSVTLPYSSALKLPVGQSVGGVAGIGAKIWTVIMGHDVNHNRDWMSDLFSSANTFAAGIFAKWDDANTGLNPITVLMKGAHSSVAVRNNPQVQMALMSLDAQPGTYAPWTTIDAALADLKTDSSLSLLQNSADGNSHHYFSMRLYDDHPSLTDNASIPGAAPKWVQGTDSLTGVFSAFAKAASVGGGSDIEVDIQVNSEFEIYQMPGKELIALETNDPDPTISHKVSRVGQSIEWDFNKMNGGFHYEIIYYVRFLGDLNDPKLNEVWRFVNDAAYIKFTDMSGNAVVKYFPENIIQLENLSQGNSQPALHTPIPETNGGPEIIRMDVTGAWGTPVPPYTPSPATSKSHVDPTPDLGNNDDNLQEMIEDDFVSEGTEVWFEENGQEVPQTADIVQTAAAFVLFTLLVSIVGFYYLSNKRKKQNSK